MRGRPASPPGPAPSSTADLFEDAYRSSGTAVLGYALRRSDSREDALDVVAETFAIAWRRRDNLPEDPAEVRPWLFGIARRCLANSARGTRRADRLGQRLAEAFDAGAVPDPSALHEHRAETQRVREALDQLSADDRELVTLVAWEGLSPAEAADVLGLTAGAARVRLHRARARLRTVLSTTHVEEADRDS
jgi:RNA polymerase sigma factor (sigma-70 family)